jgi:outer membrane protein assembly factor BamB
MVYIGAFRSVRGLDSSTGAERWRFEGVGPIQDISVEGGTVYARTLEADYALNAATGTLHWSRSDISTGISVKPTRIVSGGTLYAVGGKAIHALDAITGEIRWSQPLGRKDRFGSLAATSEGLYCQVDRRILALDANTGNTRWTQEGISSKDLLTDGTALYAAREKYLYALDVRTGAIKWITKSKSPLSLLAAINGLVYTCTNELYYGRIHALESSTGSVRWRSNLPYTGLDKLIIAYGMAYVCNHSGYRPGKPDPVSVYAINASTGASTYYAWNNV